MNYILNDKNETITIKEFLDERNKKIKKELEPILQDFLTEKHNSKKADKLGYRFAKQMLLAFKSVIGEMTEEDVNRMDYDTLNAYWTKYLEITAYYNRYFEIVDNKQMFMLYCGVHDKIYHNWEQSENEDIKKLMQTINLSFIGMGFLASESGNTDSKATKFRLGATDVGHSVVTASEQLFINGSQPSPNELLRELEQICPPKQEKPKKLK